MRVIEAIRVPFVLALSADVLVVLPLAALLVVERRLRGLPVPPFRSALAAASLGFLLGSGVLVSDAVPPVRTGLIVVIVALAAALVVRGWIRDAGAVVVAAGVPWLVYGAAAAADLAFGAPVDGPRIVSPLLVAGATVVFGAWLTVTGRRGEMPDPALPEPPGSDERRWDALARRVFRTGDWTTPPVIAGALALVGTAWFVASMTHGQSVWIAWLGFIGGSVAGAALSGIGTAFVRSPDSRRALEAYAWLAEREYVRLSALAGRTVTPTIGSLRRFVRDVPERPDNRWIRVEVLASEGRLAAAREMALRMPDATAFERLEREAELAWLDWIDGRDDDARLRAVAAAIDPGDAALRDRAEVILAVNAARLRIGNRSDDPLEPLRDARDVLGSRAGGAIFRFVGRVARGVLPVSALLEGVVLLIDRVGAG